MTRPSPPPDIRPARSVAELLTAGPLFDAPVHPSHALDLLEREGHHLFLAYATGEPVGFISGRETTHPDKGPETLLHGRGVAPACRSSGEGGAVGADAVSPSPATPVPAAPATVSATSPPSSRTPPGEPVPGWAGGPG
ncbi:GNAT family N-acetyltransferase [Streptomyces sp. CAI-17]|nr:GNAT family N-acetyltransferase [Streptomyces sp. CAI-17]